MPDVEKNIHIAAPIEKVWAALTDPTAIRGWMGEDSTVEVDLKVGGRYRLFEGNTTGVFKQIEKPNTLEYIWRQGEWDKDWPDSLVHWELSAGPNGKGTLVHLMHSQFPNTKERDDHNDGWDLYFLGPMKEWLEGKGG